MQSRSRHASCDLQVGGTVSGSARKREKGKQTEAIFRLSEEGLEKREIAARLGITEDRVSHRLDGL